MSDTTTTGRGDNRRPGHRERGFATGDQENEIGTNCVALHIYPTSPGTPAGAESVSGLRYRTPLHVLVDAVDEMRATLGSLGEARR